MYFVIIFRRFMCIAVIEHLAKEIKDALKPLVVDFQTIVIEFMSKLMVEKQCPATQLFYRKID